MALFYKCNTCNTELNEHNCFTFPLIDKKKALSPSPSPSPSITHRIISKYKLKQIIVCDICFDKLTIIDKKEYISIIDSNNFFGLLCKDSRDDKFMIHQKYKYENIKNELTHFVYPPIPSSPPPNYKIDDIDNIDTTAPIKIFIKLTKNKEDKDTEDKDTEDTEDKDTEDASTQNIIDSFDKEIFNYIFNGLLNNNTIKNDIPNIININSKNDKLTNNKTNKQQKRKLDDIDDDLELINLKQIELEKKYDYEWIGDDIYNIDDLIELGKSYKERSKKKRRYNLNIKTLHNLVEPLEELNKMIGLESIKETIFNQIVFYLQELDDKNNDMLHTVIEGPPGVGKTHISKIIAKIYKGLGFLKNDKIVSIKRDDFIGKYLGHTADKTRKKIEEALGGVLFIDEAYSLGDPSGKDSYSKEAIDMLTSYLSEHPHDLICIVAGYKESLNRNFFSQNEGLSRRFTHRFELKEYNGNELKHIFFKIIEDNNWLIFDKAEINTDFFETNKKYFKFNGGDMLTLFGYCKKEHSKRLLKIPNENDLLKTKKKINNEDIKNGFSEFIKNPEYAERGDDLQPLMLYT